MQGIYVIINTNTFRYYIGSSINIERRWNDHRQKLARGTSKCTYLQNSYNKHGPDAFQHFVLEEVVDVNTLLEREQFWMDTMKSHDRTRGYNCQKKAGSTLGWKPSESTRKKMRDSHLGHKASDETRAKMRDSHSGHQHSKETREKLRAASAGRTCGEEAKAKLRAANLGKTLGEQTKAKLRAANLGKTHTEEARDKLRVANLGKKHSEETKAKMRAARQRNLQTYK